jgi:sulfate adenylyltransferase subunit 2
MISSAGIPARDRIDMVAKSHHPAHLDALEAESIHILREVAAQASRPVLLYSIGKDSSVLLHLARKAFFPAKPPFPLLHIDTTWKFHDMITFRDATVKRFGFELRVHTNPEGLRQNVNPFDHGSNIYTQVMKTDALKQALTEGRYDFAIGGARRDEERSRAKERVFSVRGPGHSWDPKRQRPELWHLYNGNLSPGETLRVFPLSNWTELDVWTYILAEGIDVVPLYFAAKRQTVDRDGQIIVVDDERMRFREGERPVTRLVRFRSLGCYPLSAAVDSPAANLEEIVEEMRTTRVSERAGRLIDQDQEASMEKKKREGYF